MSHPWKWNEVVVKKLPRRLRHSTLWMLLIIMPVGVRVDGEHGKELTIEGHAGVGQLASVIRDCSGHPIRSESSNFTDFAGALQYSHRYGEGNFFVIGLRAGRFQMDGQRVFPLSGQSIPFEYDYRYWNPYVAMEMPYGGVGFGYITNDPLVDFSEGHMGVPVSFHMRFGNYIKTHFLMSYNENMPMVSGGGNFIMGLGYPAGRRAMLFSGFSAAPYDRLGLVQKLSWQLSDRFDMDLNARIGQAAGHFEGSISLGLRYHLPLGPKTGPNIFIEQNREEKKTEEKSGYKEIG